MKHWKACEISFFILTLALAATSVQSEVQCDPTLPDVVRAGRQAIQSFAHQGHLNTNDWIWEIRSATKKKVDVRHNDKLRSTTYNLNINVQIGGKMCSRCINPQLLGGQCRVLSVQVIHYTARKTFVIPHRSQTEVICHEDFINGVRSGRRLLRRQ